MVQLTPKNWAQLLGLTVGVFALLMASLVDFGIRPPTVATWQRQVSPGHLSAAHAMLANNCAACHTGVKGVDVTKCISCHAGNKTLLARQPTAFHATVGNCVACHGEHQGVNANLREMNHAALAKVGIKFVSGGKEAPDYLLDARLPADHPLLTALEASLKCASCHNAQFAPHYGLFGTNCASCHAATQWTIPKFQHPSVLSISCNQCHKPPPSHLMMHFEMVDKAVVAQGNGEGKGEGEACCGGVVVSQCYKCHKTTSWNDIQGVGFYKHH
jgi:hypothetical protein